MVGLRRYGGTSDRPHRRVELRSTAAADEDRRTLRDKPLCGGDPIPLLRH
jgi:hypothetical protein